MTSHLFSRPGVHTPLPQHSQRGQRTTWEPVLSSACGPLGLKSVVNSLYPMSHLAGPAPTIQAMSREASVSPSPASPAQITRLSRGPFLLCLELTSPVRATGRGLLFTCLSISLFWNQGPSLQPSVPVDVQSSCSASTAPPDWLIRGL